jgi:BRCA2, oligonucleotide/oligosaccharide-binding, domain 1
VDGTTEGVPELEVTDGWYRLRAEVDGPLVRAIRRGVIKAGRKISVANAKVRNSAECILRYVDKGSAGFRPQGTLGNP